MNRCVKMDANLGVSREGYAGRIEVLGGPTGRLQYSDAEKARIAAERLAPDGAALCSGLAGAPPASPAGRRSRSAATRWPRERSARRPWRPKGLRGG